MSKWGKFAQKAKQEQGGDTTPHQTMNLRQVIKLDGSMRIEQLIEHRNQQGMVVDTEWVEIPRLMETEYDTNCL